MSAERPTLARAVDAQIATLSPAYFALVMATGIVSIACHLLGISYMPDVLFGINVVAYATLWVLTGIRVARHADRMLVDFRHHSQAPGYFTLVAASCILGTQCLVLYGQHGPAEVLWYVAIVLWVGYIYAFFTILSVGKLPPVAGAGVNGTWLLIIVATEAVAVLGVLLVVARPSAGGDDVRLFFCVCMFLLGCFLYLPFITMILQRLTFHSMTAMELSPPYWINMGAVAITTLAGSVLLLATVDWPFLAVLRPFLIGFTLFFWAAATWWIPLLVVMGVWRHGYAGYPLRYDPQYWGLVFPLGMYTVATFRLSEATGVTLLKAIPEVSVYVALGAWALTFIGLLRRMLHVVVARPLPAPRG